MNRGAGALGCGRRVLRPRVAEWRGSNSANCVVRRPISREGRVEAQSACTEGRDLQKTARHRDILEEMDELVLIREVGMEHERGDQRERASADAASRVR